MLEYFRKVQEPRIRLLLALEERGAMPEPYAGWRPSFSGALRRGGGGNSAIRVIAEYKRASTSGGDINLAAAPEEIAALYASCGACAISVLTEETKFKGQVSYIERMAHSGLPLLRKDFLIHPLQVAETAATPASALLLIARMLDETLLPAMLLKAREYGLEAVLEVFDHGDLRRTRKALRDTGTRPAVIQVNNRDLQSMRVDAEVSRRLIQRDSDDEVWISASGINCRRDVEERAALGYDAVLAGTFLMSSRNPGEALAELTQFPNRTCFPV
jgi:indole-3-glycerol phosphate synthase